VKFYNPVPGHGPTKIADTFGPGVRPGGHTGWDFRCPTFTPVVASAPGYVYEAGFLNVDCGWGVRVNSDGWPISYCHFTDGEVRVNVGDLVDYQTVLGLSGESGNAVYPHLHASWENPSGVKIDPATILEGEGWIRDGWVDPRDLSLRHNQWVLRKRGYYSGTLDGLWGPLTEQAVRDFQGTVSIARSGELDAVTLAVLYGRGKWSRRPGG